MFLIGVVYNSVALKTCDTSKISIHKKNDQTLEMHTWKYSTALMFGKEEKRSTCWLWGCSAGFPQYETPEWIIVKVLNKCRQGCFNEHQSLISQYLQLRQLSSDMSELLTRQYCDNSFDAIKIWVFIKI